MRKNPNTNQLEQQVKSLQHDLITAIESKTSSANEETASMHATMILMALSLFKQSIEKGNGLRTANTLLNDFKKTIQTYSSSSFSQTENSKNIEDLEELITKLEFFIEEANKLLGRSNISGGALPGRSLFTEQTDNLRNNNQNIIPSEQNRDGSRNVNNNNNNSEPRTLLDAIKSKNLEEVKRFITMDKALLEPGRHGVSPLHDAAAYGSVEIVNYFIDDCGIATDLENNFGQTALHYAALEGNNTVVSHLINDESLKKLKLIDKQDQDGNTPLMYALQRDQLQTASLLCISGANLMLANGSKKAPIHYFSQINMRNIADKDKRDKKEKEITAFVILLLSFISDDMKREFLNLPYSSNKITPIMMAAEAGNLMLVKLLSGAIPIEQFRPLVQFVELSYKNENEKHTPIHDGKGTSILHYAAKSGNFELFNFIFDKVKYYGNELNIENNKHETILMFAAQSGSPKIVQFLIEKGVSINAVSSSVQQPNEAPPTQRTALHYAVQSRNVGVVEALIKARAETNIQDESGATSLHYAVRSDNIEIVKILIEAGAKIDIKDKGDDTPLDYAKEIDDDSQKLEMLGALGAANLPSRLTF